MPERTANRPPTDRGEEIAKDDVVNPHGYRHSAFGDAAQFFQEFLGAARHIPHWIISYRDQAFPTEKEIKKIVAAAGKSSRMKSREHQYHISAKHGENSTAKEHLFVCTPAAAASSGELADEDGLVALARFGAALDDSLRAAAPGWDEEANEYRVRPPTRSSGRAAPSPG